MGMRAWLGAVLVAAAGLWIVSGASASPGSGPTAIVALGDSFISGEGGRWLGNGSEPLGTRSGTDRAAFGCDGWSCEYDPARVYGSSEANGCHRSDVSPILSAPVAVEEKLNLACSGARVENLWPALWGGRPHFGEAPQANQLAAVARRDEVRMVVVTAGATTSASASWSPAAHWGGRGVPRTTPRSVAVTLRPMSTPRCRRWQGG